MKVFIHYEGHANEEMHKTSKVTLPKKWLSGPLSAVLDLFLSAYNPKYPANQLEASKVHLENDKGQALSGECIVSDYIAPSADIYVKHGPAPLLTSVTAGRIGASPPPPPTPPPPVHSVDSTGLQLCKRFGCQKKFDPTHNHDASCTYHRLPPVFHETVKFWACCPDKKTYSWDSFMEVQGCTVGAHTNEKPKQPSVLGGVDVRDGNDGSETPASEGERLKTIAEYNAERKMASDAGGNDAGAAIASLYQLRQSMDKAGVPGALFDSAKEAATVNFGGDHVAVAKHMAQRLSECLEAIKSESA